MNFSVIEKLHSKSQIIGKCWIWNGGKTKGYGQTTINYRNYRVHRLSLSIFHRLDYDGSWTANHLCSNRTCWNPLHLYAGTNQDNVEDSIRAGNHNGSKTHCVNGHEYSKSNTYIKYSVKGMERQCRACDRIRKRKQ